MFPPAILSKARQLATVTPVCFPAARSWAAAKCLPVLLGSAMSDLGARHLTLYREGVGVWGLRVSSGAGLPSVTATRHKHTQKSLTITQKAIFFLVFFTVVTFWHFFKLLVLRERLVFIWKLLWLIEKSDTPMLIFMEGRLCQQHSYRRRPGRHTADWHKG